MYYLHYVIHLYTANIYMYRSVLTTSICTTYYVESCTAHIYIYTEMYVEHCTYCVQVYMFHN